MIPAILALALAFFSKTFCALAAVICVLQARALCVVFAASWSLQPMLNAHACGRYCACLLFLVLCRYSWWDAFSHDYLSLPFGSPSSLSAPLRLARRTAAGWSGRKG